MSDVTQTVRDALQLEAKRVHQLRGNYPSTVFGLLVTGPGNSGKQTALWDAMAHELKGWTFVQWPHHMDHPEKLADMLGHRVVVWLDNLHDYASPGESAALHEFLARLVRSHKQVMVLALCRTGVPYQEAQRYFAPLMDILRPVRLDGGQHEELKRVNKATLKAQYAGLGVNEQLVIQSINWLKNAGVVTFPEPTVEIIARNFFGFSGPWEAPLDRLAAKLPDYTQFLKREDRASARTVLEDIDLGSIFKNRSRSRRSTVVNVKVIVPVNVYSLDGNKRPQGESDMDGASADMPTVAQGGDGAQAVAKEPKQEQAGQPDATTALEALVKQGEVAIETLILLGDSYLSARRGDVRSLSAKASECYKAARGLLLTSDPSYTFATAWAAALVGYGDAELHQAQLRESKGRAIHLDNAYTAFQAVIKDIVPAAKPPVAASLVAHARHGLGDVEYARAAAEEPLDTAGMLRAADYYRDVLLRPDKRSLFPNEGELDTFLGKTKLDLANALREVALEKANLPGQLEDAKAKAAEARAIYGQALLVYSKDFAPTVWAEIERSLADLHYVEIADANPISIQQVENIQGHYFAAVTVFSPHFMEYNWAQAMLGLAKAYALDGKGRELGQSDLANNRYNRAIEALAAADDIFSASRMPLDWVDAKLLRARIALAKFNLLREVNESERKFAKDTAKKCRDALEEVRDMLRIDQNIALKRLVGDEGMKEPKVPLRFTRFEMDLDELEKQIDAL